MRPITWPPKGTATSICPPKYWSMRRSRPGICTWSWCSISAVSSVRSARIPGRPKRFSSTVSVSAASTTACFQLSWTGDSAADSILVPICTPSAPSASAAAIDTPSQMPPAAMTGTSTSARTSGASTMVDEPWGFLNPPPSTPSTMRPSTPASTALSAPRRVGTT